MNKIMVGLMFGAILGFVDGTTAWFTPEARTAIGGILIGSTIKGMIVGLLCGWFARKVQSTTWGVVLGAGLGLLFAWIIAAMEPPGHHHYLEIMLPGFTVGLIIGFLTQRMGAPAPQRQSA